MFYIVCEYLLLCDMMVVMWHGGWYVTWWFLGEGYHDGLVYQDACSSDYGFTFTVPLD